MDIKKIKNVKKCSDKHLLVVRGGTNLYNGKPVSNIAQCVFSFFKKC